MRDDRAFRLRGKFIQMVLPGFRDTSLAFRIGKLRGCGAAAVRIAANMVVQKSSRVNLPERFL